MQFESSISGTTNVSPLLEIDEDQPPHRFEDSSAYAEMQWAGHVRISHRRWWVEYGVGSRERYDGNSDAGQLWVDLHSSERSQPSYAPRVANELLETSWVGIGRSFPLRAGSTYGTGSMMFRRLSADDLRIRYLSGNMVNEDFSGLMRVTDSQGRQGEGWSLDLQANLALGDRWRGQFTVEGLLGRISWEQAYVEDSYFVSPRVFEDPEGFLHDYWAVSGIGRYEDQSYAINPYYSIDLVRKGQPNLLLGVNWQEGVGTLPSLGAAWPQSKPWLPYVRYFPTQGRLQLGAVGRGWQFRLSSDDLTSPRHAEIALSGSGFRF